MKPEDCTGCRYLRPHVHMVSASGGCFKAPICGWVDRPVARVRSCHGPIPDPPSFKRQPDVPEKRQGNQSQLIIRHTTQHHPTGTNDRLPSTTLCT
ncbi:MAG: hypothetical protein WC343_08255 [Bacilli bacterium]|jgi:hypothetical protein